MREFRAEIQWMNPNDLIPHANNAVIHSPAQVAEIASLIAAFGFDQPIVVDASKIILKGHGRREAALKLGMTEVPVIVSNLDEYQAMAARIADNKVSSKDFKLDALKFELGTLNRNGFNLSLTAIKPLELRSLLPSDEVPKQIIGNVGSTEPTEEYQADPVTHHSDFPEGDIPSDDQGVQNEGGYFMGLTPVIQYNIVFDTKEQQDAWHAFVSLLREKYPDLESIAARLMKYIEEHAIQETSQLS